MIVVYEDIANFIFVNEKIHTYFFLLNVLNLVKIRSLNCSIFYLSTLDPMLVEKIFDG
jgi:hypothetical protein